MYPRKTHYNMKEAWKLEVILAINLKTSRGTNFNITDLGFWSLK